jgi:cytochrome P450
MLTASAHAAASPRSFTAMPRAPRLPIVGSVPSVVLQRFEFFEAAHRDLGDIFRVDIGAEELVVVVDAGAAEEIFATRASTFDKGGAFWDGGREAIGNGLAMSTGEVWRRQRRLMNPAFRRERIAGFRTTIEATVAELIAQLPTDGAAIDIAPWTSDLLSTLTVRLLIGSNLGPREFAALRAALQTLIDHTMLGMVTQKLPAWLPLPGGARFDEARRTVNDVVLQVIRDRRASAVPGDDLLAMLLAATDEDGAMSDEQLRDEIVVTYIAGYETTAWAIAWGPMELARQPEHLAALQTAMSTSMDPLTDPVLEATLKEILRLYPSAPLIPRRAVVDEALLGYAIPQGTTVVVMPWLMHRHPRYWPEPTRFDPRRHLGSNERPKLAWMPFGAGQRLCIGQGLAMMEGSIALAQLVTRFTPTPAAQVSEPRFSATLSARDGIHVCLQPR